MPPILYSVVLLWLGSITSFSSYTEFSVTFVIHRFIHRGITGIPRASNGDLRSIPDPRNYFTEPVPSHHHIGIEPKRYMPGSIPARHGKITKRIIDYTASLSTFCQPVSETDRSKASEKTSELFTTNQIHPNSL